MNRKKTKRSRRMVDLALLWRTSKMYLWNRTKKTKIVNARSTRSPAILWCKIPDEYLQGGHFWKRCLNKQRVGALGANYYKITFNDITKLEHIDLNYYNKMINSCNYPAKYKLFFIIKFKKAKVIRCVNMIKQSSCQWHPKTISNLINFWRLRYHSDEDTFC